jgi:hypothetical protein
MAGFRNINIKKPFFFIAQFQGFAPVAALYGRITAWPADARKKSGLIIDICVG